MVCICTRGATGTVVVTLGNSLVSAIEPRATVALAGAHTLTRNYCVLSCRTPPQQVQCRLQQVRTVDRGPQDEPEAAVLHAHAQGAQPYPQAGGGTRQRQTVQEQKGGGGRVEAGPKAADEGGERGGGGGERGGGEGRGRRRFLGEACDRERWGC